MEIRSFAGHLRHHLQWGRRLRQIGKDGARQSLPTSGLVGTDLL
jgi:hypothetical protein